jgi:NADPH:quinone reductase-like Zn-dependent oxidoreductase
MILVTGATTPTFADGTRRSQMRAIVATQFGGPDVLKTSTAPDPVAQPGQVVVDVAVADALFVDTQIRRGWVASTSRSSRRTCRATAWPGL